MRIREFLYWFTWGLLFVGVIIYGGCYSPTETIKQEKKEITENEVVKQRTRSREQKADDRPNFTSWQLDYGLYAFTYEGHLYFWELDGFILHVSSCPGVHTLVGP